MHMNIFVVNLFRDPAMFFTVIVSVGISVCIHEFCHAYAALKCGDSTAADAGHLTLNPLKQMGWISVIMLLLLGFCWGSVPVNPNNLTRRGRVAVSLAGPGANIALFCVGVIVFLAACKLKLELLLVPAMMFSQLNLVLFCINIAPVPGFDGGALLAETGIAGKLYSSELGKGFMVGMLLLLFYLVDYIFVWSYNITTAVIKFLWSFIS